MYAPLPSLSTPDSQSMLWYKEDYDLVKIHHPDSAHCRHLDPSIRHARFQSIRSAYDYLMGKGYTSSGSYDSAFSELDRIRRAQEAHRRARRRAAEFAARTEHAIEEGSEAGREVAGAAGAVVGGILGAVFGTLGCFLEGNAYINKHSDAGT